jgi:exosortase/archaeosortase family protein
MMDKVNTALTRNTANTSGWVINKVLGIPVQVTEVNLGYKWHLHSADKDGVRIAHPCNAFELYFLYVAFIVAFANVPLLRKWKFAVLGLLALYLFNILRVVLLFYVSGKWPDFFDFMHKYLFQAGAYILMFGLWYWLLHQRSHGK